MEKLEFETLKEILNNTKKTNASFLIDGKILHFSLKNVSLNAIAKDFTIHLEE